METSIIKHCIREGRPLPAKIQNAPQLMLGLELYFNAFQDLDTCRSYGQTEGPIPWTAIKSYAEMNDFSDGQTEDLLVYIPDMDKVFLKFLSKRAASG